MHLENHYISVCKNRGKWILYNDDKLYTSVKTNDDGIINIPIPYGSYRLHQVSSKYGYYKVEDINFESQTIRVNSQFTKRKIKKELKMK